MLPAMELLYADFFRRLRPLQRKLAVQRFGFVVITVLPAAVVAGVFCRWSMMMPWISAAGTFLIFLAAGSGVLFLRRFPRRKECVRCFDAAFGTNSRAVNALEVIETGKDSLFAAYTIAEGIRSLAAFRTLPDRRPYRKRRLAGWYMAMLLTGSAMCLWQPSASGNPGPEAGGAAVTAAALAAADEIRPDANRPGEAPEPELAVGAAGNSPVPAAAGSDRHRPGNRANSGAGTGGVADFDRPGAAPEPEAASPSAEAPSPSAAIAMGNADAAGEWESSEAAPDAAQLAGGKEGLARERSRQSRRKRQMRRNPEAAAGGAQPMMADNAPPAGRELSELDGEGDEPDSGRGGPTGEKKSRGTASMLPVTPLPDLVNGSLVPGEEMTIPERSPLEHADPVHGAALAASHRPEPLRPEYTLPLTIRKTERIP